MYESAFCHACLSSNRSLSSVGDYIDIYIKICDNSLMNLTSQINVCWECLALLKKVQIFRRKVDKAQKILDYFVDKQIPLEDSLSNLTLSNVEATSYIFPVSNEEADYENYLDNNANAIDNCGLDKDIQILEEPYKDARVSEDSDLDVRLYDDSYNELMFKIEDVRGRCDILHAKPALEGSTCSGDVTVKIEHLSSPEDEEERQHCRWKRSAMLVYKRICSHHYAQHFMRPVSDDLAPLYSRIVRRPTDLSTIRRRIKEGVIRTTAEFTRALLLMFSNALMYNSSHHFIYQMTLDLREETLRELSLLAEAEAGAECPLARLQRRAAPPPEPLTPPSAPVAPPPRWRASGRQDDELKTPTEPAAPRGLRAPVIVTAEPPKSAALRGRRASAYVPVEPPKPAALRSRRATVFVPAEPPKPAAPRGRRASVYEPVEPPKPAAPRGRQASVYEPVEPPKPAAPRSRRASVFVPADPPKPAALRNRRATVFVPTEPPKPAAPRGRRASVFVPAEPPKPAAPRGRRASVFVPAEPPKPAAPRKRTKYEWPSLDDEYLIPKKYKNSVVVLL